MKLSRPVIYALLAMVVLILGLNWPVMATGVKSIAPIWMGAFRIGTATALMVRCGHGEEDTRCATAQRPSHRRLHGLVPSYGGHGPCLHRIGARPCRPLFCGGVDDQSVDRADRGDLSRREDELERDGSACHSASPES